MMLRIAVVGGYNLGVIVKPKLKKDSQTNNNLSICFRAGGVGRNISEALCRMGCQVTFITVSDQDSVSRALLESLRDLNVDIVTLAAAPTGVYLAIMKEGGVLDASYCDMSGVESISFRDIVEYGLDFSCFDGVAVEANLREDTIVDLCNHLRMLNVPYAIDPVSTTKAFRLRKVLNGCTLIKPNQYEAEVLTGLTCRTMRDGQKCGEWFIKQGVENVAISMGEQGFLLCNKQSSKGFSSVKVDVIDENGAGDSLLSALFRCILTKTSQEDTGRIGIKCATLTCCSTKPISPLISSELFL